MADFNTTIIDEFRSHQGEVGGRFTGATLLLMTTHGAKTGKESVIPVVYTKDADKFVIVASKGGAPNNPGWYYNLLAHPQITIEVGTEKFQVHAVNITGKERDRLFDQHANKFPYFNEYKNKTTRVIPVFVLKRT
jgi:deazaflavin-dependent oxidoreductase (nitroreductase family)